MKQVQDNIKRTRIALVNAYNHVNAVYDTLGNNKTMATPQERQDTASMLIGEVNGMRKLLDDIEKGITEDINTNTI